MRSLILIVLYIFTPILYGAIEKDPGNDDLMIHIMATEKEVSKDSHSTEYDILLLHGVFMYSSESHGYKAPEGIEYVSSLSPEQVSDLEVILLENNLLVSDTTINNESVVGMYFICHLKITYKGTEYMIYIDGAEDYFEDEELVQGVKTLLNALKRY